jgi:hypothetical protein
MRVSDNRIELNEYLLKLSSLLYWYLSSVKYMVGLKLTN